MKTKLLINLLKIAHGSIIEANKANPFIDRREAWRQYNQARAQLNNHIVRMQS